jgi:hypothetical protein
VKARAFGAVVVLLSSVARAQPLDMPPPDMPPEDLSAPSTAVGAGSIKVQVRDSSDRPVPRTEVRLLQSLLSHDDEPSRAVRVATTDADGKVTFDGLGGGRGVAYEARVEVGRATFTSGQFDLPSDRGQEVILHVYPATTDLDQAQVALQTLTYVVPRDDVFQWEVLLTVFNAGRVAWVIDDTRLGLPRDATGIEFESRSPALAWAKEDTSARLVGTAPPGRHEILLRFQVKSRHDEHASFHFDLPPRIARAEIVAEGPPGLKLEVADAPAAELRAGPKGQRLWVVGWQARPDGPALRELAITVSGIPTPGSGRWIALGVALLLVAWGAWPTNRRSAGTLSDEEATNARSVVLDELVALERARQDGEVGSGTYEATRGKLLRALSEFDRTKPRDEPPARPTRRWRQGHQRARRKRK